MRLLKDFAYGVDHRGKDVHSHKFLNTSNCAHHQDENFDVNVSMGTATSGKYRSRSGGRQMPRSLSRSHSPAGNVQRNDAVIVGDSLAAKFSKLIKLLQTNYRSWAPGEQSLSPQRPSSKKPVERPLSFRVDVDFKGRSNMGKQAQLDISLVRAEIETLECALANSSQRENKLIDIAHRIYIRVEELLSNNPRQVKLLNAKNAQSALTNDKELRAINRELRELIASKSS